LSVIVFLHGAQKASVQNWHRCQKLAETHDDHCGFTAVAVFRCVKQPGPVLPN